VKPDSVKRGDAGRRRANGRAAPRAPTASPGRAVLRETLVSAVGSVAVCAVVGALLSLVI
jgi:hypothetical protein